MPLRRSRAAQFDDLVLEAVGHLEKRWAKELEGVEFAVEDVPPIRLELLDGALSDYNELDPDAVSDETGVPLGRLLSGGQDPGAHRPSARIILYRRPLEARSVDRGELADLVLDVVVEQVARLLDLDPDEIDPPE